MAAYRRSELSYAGFAALFPVEVRRKNYPTRLLVLSCLIHAVAGRTFPAGERGSAAGSLLSSHCPSYTWACVLCRPSPPEFPFRFIWVLGWSTWHLALDPSSVLIPPPQLRLFYAVSISHHLLCLFYAMYIFCHLPCPFAYVLSIPPSAMPLLCHVYFTICYASFMPLYATLFYATSISTSSQVSASPVETGRSGAVAASPVAPL
jgi:hypothetical protein